ncbi:MAG: RdgB/HAM1 family non-canonical purine NTP pyrophosphatase [PS1 clade bacterium]|nr:RdgB/HAM1 family non-canonical purine NTP pyrophosphatase [PS1 clade bacterium]MBL6783650.1 RdgB/HAM1 family non-canonical purine NTP pyrophosphatase [PS1 clade bacterium]
MARAFAEPKLIVASHNKGKLVEIADLLSRFAVETVGADALGLPEPEETGDTFIANAELKALAAATKAGLPALSDDSGLAVDALDGAPGIYSARWAETANGRDFDFAMHKIEMALHQKGDVPRTARFICALTLAWPDGHVESFEGKVEGTLVWPMRGENGFGYDPIFLPLGGDMTFGEMEPAAKHAMSHRADAFTQLVNACFVGQGG